jgi:chromosomal replication initiator protein
MTAIFSQGSYSASLSSRCPIEIGTSPEQEAERLGPNAGEALRKAHAARRARDPRTLPATVLKRVEQPEVVMKPLSLIRTPETTPEEDNTEARIERALRPLKARIAELELIAAKRAETESEVPPVKNAPTIQDIVRVVAARYFPVTVRDILSSRRTAIIVRPRQLAMYLAKQLTLRSYPEIGRKFGGRDHSTAIHAVQRIESLCAIDPTLREELALLKKMLGGQ